MKPNKDVLLEIFTFSGRTPRSGYWLSLIWYVVVVFIAQPIIGILKSAHIISIDGGDNLSYYITVLILAIAMESPRVPITVRRLHDLNFSGWWYPILLITPINLLPYFFRGTKGKNRYGEDPLGLSQN